MRAPFTIYLRWPGAWLYASDALTLSEAKRRAIAERGELAALIVVESTRETTMLQPSAQRWKTGPDARSLLLVE